MSILSDPFPSLLALRRRVMPPPEPPPEPGVPEWERIAGEIIVIRRQQRGPAEPPDRIVFGPYRKACAEDLDYGEGGT